MQRRRNSNNDDFYRLGRDQAKKEIKKWLKQTFKRNKDSTIAREFVFRRYKQFCTDVRIESTSQSAFGRILKDVFPNLDQRRLGPRNNNKMHYLHLGLVNPATGGHTHRTCSSGPSSPRSSPTSSSRQEGDVDAVGQITASSTADGVRTHPGHAANVVAQSTMLQGTGELKPATIDHLDFLSAPISSSSPDASPRRSDPYTLDRPHQPEPMPQPPFVFAAAHAHEVPYHSWALLPFLASAELLEGQFGNHPCLLELARFVAEFVHTGFGCDFKRLEAIIISAFGQARDDLRMHHAMIALAWWTRLMYVDESEARGRAVDLLGAVISVFEHSPLNFPALELLRSCEHVTSQAPLMPNVLALQSELDQWGQLTGEVSSFKRTVGKIIFHATQTVSLHSPCEVKQSAELLINELMSASTALILTSLHELHCRGMLEMVVNVLLGLRQLRADEVFLPVLLEAAHFPPSDLPQPHNELFAPLAVPQPTFAHVPKIEQQHDSDDHRLCSIPSSPFPSTEPRVAAAMGHAGPTSHFSYHDVQGQPPYMSSPSPSSSPSLFGFAPAPIIQPLPYHQPLYQHHPHMPIYHHPLAPPPPYHQYHQQPVFHHHPTFPPSFASHAPPAPPPPPSTVLTRPPSSSLPTPPEWAEPHLGPE